MQYTRIDHFNKKLLEFQGIDNKTIIVLQNMFNLIQEPFKKHAQYYDRLNFLNFDYVIYKIFEIVGLTDHLINIKLLRSTDNLKNHDMIWKGICADLDWKFVES